MTVVDLFAGPGGADEGLRMAGITDVVGIEWDTDACATARAAGHERVQADVSELDPYPCSGLWASPPCQAWSMAGKRAALADQERLGRHAEACRGGWVPYDPADYADERTPLVLEPLRWADASRPRWVVCEQVPPVADLWAHYADVLRGWGYNAWAGVLNAADYGVPQTRYRAFLIARLHGSAAPPEPTHAKHPHDAGLFGGGRRPWVTMAQALGWGADDPSPTVIGRCGRTGNKPWGVRGQTMLASRRDSPGWVAEHGERPDRADDEPAPSITGEAHRWQWVNGNQHNSAVRSLDEPAPTVHFGHRTNDVKWVHERPATSVCADPRVPEPGWRGNPDDYADGNPTRSGDNAVRVTVQQAAILQGFPADYPWQGSKTSQFAQVGNAVPPPLSAAICAGLVQAKEAA